MKDKMTYTTPMTAEVMALIDRYMAIKPLDNACFDMKWWVEFAKEYLKSKKYDK